MTLQFRSRIKSKFDYGAQLKTAGKCCFDGLYESLTFLECFKRGGQFFQDPDAPCPSPSDKGYCCACSYLTNEQRADVIANLPYSIDSTFFQNNFGIQSNVTKCECDRIGGNWHANTLDYTLCKKEVQIDGTNKNIDVRIPMACCSLLLQDNVPIGVTCQNVCGPRACSNLAIADSGGSDTFYDTVYTENKTCGVPIVSGVAGVECSTSAFTTRMASFTPAFANDSYGPCYSLNDNGTDYSYDCTLTTEFQCDGYWIDPAIDGETVTYCGHRFEPVTPTLSNNYVNTIEYTQAEFNSLGLQIGDEFQGGIYIGTFKPLKPNATNPSKVYGSMNFGTPQSIYVNVTDESEYVKWAVIVNKSFLTTTLLTSNDVNITINTSYYDGYMNAYGSATSSPRLNSVTLNTIAGNIRNGFIDYYVPSIIEMMYFGEQIINNPQLLDIFDINGLFCSTSFLTDEYISTNPNGTSTFNGNNLLYSYNFSSGQNFGKSAVVGINNDVKLMLFRRIAIV